MKQKITSLILGISVVASVLPVSVFAQYDYSAPATSDVYYYDYSSTGVSSYNYTSPSVSSYNYTSPSVSTYNYTSPSVSTYNYTSPSVSSYNYTSPTVSTYNYTSPSVSTYDYTSPSYTYTSPTYTSPTYTTPTYTYPTTYGTTDYGYTGISYPTTYGSTGSYGYTGGYGYINVNYTGNTDTTNTTTCPSGSHLVNNSCVINTTSCPSGSTLINGSCVTNTTTCPSGSHLVNTTCVVDTTTCPTGSSLVNGVCQVNTTSCPSGSTLVNGVCTVTTVVNNYTCSNGIVVAYSYLCPTTYTYPTYTYPTYTYTTPTITYQVCWDGSTIPSSSMCPQQYKVCANGSYISVNQSCYVAPTHPYIEQPVVKFNNVVTSVVTQITNTSGRCNGIGLIANGAPSTGWFEYGETASLGRTTATASIGNGSTAPFSNVLANLKSNTKYYCRAVMQNQYGIVKGEIVSFVTKSKVTTYVEPVATVKKVATKKTVAPKKPQVTCTDGTTISVKSESSASLLAKGEKLVALQIEKTGGNFYANSIVSYKVSYKNLSGARLTGVVVKIVLPAEINFTLATAGTYDANTHTLTLNQDTFDAQSEGSIAIEGRIAMDAPIGKTVVATTYVIYTVPGTSVQDEVTAYVVSSIVPTDVISKEDTGAKKVIGASSERGFMPNNLVEWLALIAILFIIFILGRSIYVSYKEDEGEVSGH